MKKRPIMPEDLYGYRWPSQPAVAADGSIAYVEQTVDRDNNAYATNIRLIDANGHDQPLTEGGKDSSPAWSPDGTRLAFLRAEAGRKGLWTLTVDASGGLSTAEPKLLITPDHNIQQFIWSPDGKYLAFTRKVGSGPAVTAETAAAHVKSAQSPSDQGQSSQSQSNPVPSELSQSNQQESVHNGAVQLDSPKTGTGPLLGKVYDRTTPRAEGSGWWDGKYTHLFIYELESGEVKRLTYGAWNATAPVWSPDSSKLAFVSKQVEDTTLDADLQYFTDIYEITLDGEQPRKITVSELLIEQIAYAGDGTQLTLLASDRLYGSGSHLRLYLVPVAGGRPELLAPELDMQLGNAALSDMKSAAPSRAPQIDPASKDLAVYVPGTHEGTVGVYRMDTNGAVRSVTGAGEKDIYQYVVSPDGTQLITAALTDKLPAELYRTDLRSGEVERVTRLNDDYFADLEVIIPERFSFTASDGLTIQGWIMWPEQPTEAVATSENAGIHGKLPLVLQIHGGPHAMYTGTFSHELQTLAAQGYAVLWVNPRGSMGYGQEFARACRGDVCGGDYRDLMEAVDAALERYDFLDADRLGVGGGSYGGVMTNWIVSQTDRFRAAVSHRSISNWISLYGTSDIGISYVEGVVGGNPIDDLEMLWSRSPLAHVRNIRTPLLLLHGEADLRTPIAQADELYTALKRHGRTTRLVRFPGCNHSMLKSGKPSLRVDNFKHVNAWFARYLNDDPNSAASNSDNISKAGMNDATKKHISTGGDHSSDLGRVRLSIPVGLLMENMLSSGEPVEVIVAALRSRNLDSLLSKVKEPGMDVLERLQTAEELNEDWERALREGYEFKFLHINGVKRLLDFRFGRKAERDYIQDENSLRQLWLHPQELDTLQAMLQRQWQVVEEEREASAQNGTPDDEPRVCVTIKLKVSS